jgi:hypothetical protein
MTPDEVISAALVLSFASFVTAHVALVVGLLGRAPRWRAPVALVIAPLAPWWARKERMHGRVVAWVVAAAAYVALRWMASR